MTISSLELTNFRNYRKKPFDFDPRLTLLAGANGSGKTNLLEAIYLLATGGSWRTSRVEEMVQFDSEVSHIIAEVSAVSPLSKVTAAGEKKELRVTLTKGYVNGKPTPKLRYQLDGVGKRKADFIGQLKAVIFEPESLDIVVGEPKSRRFFLDTVLTQTDSEYSNSLQLFHKALRRRNRLLDRIREGHERKEILDYWERTLVKHGSQIQTARRKLIRWLDASITQASTWRTPEAAFPELRLTYQPNLISQPRLDLYRERETAAGHTFVGPQRDDLGIAVVLTKNVRSLAAFGSRGQQRMAVLKLKLLEAGWIEQETKVKPVILLDDIFSELDEDHEKMVGSLVEDRQAIITATEIHQKHYPKGKVIKLNQES